MKHKTHTLNLTVGYKEVEGGYIGVIVEMAGVISQGKTLNELMSNLADAAMAMIKSNKIENANLMHNGESMKEIPLVAC